MSFKVTSDGTVGGTYLYANGKVIGDVNSIKWEVKAGEEVSILTIELQGVEIEVSGKNIELIQTGDK